jgi:hypothetical protein
VARPNQAKFDKVPPGAAFTLVLGSKVNGEEVEFYGGLPRRHSYGCGGDTIGCG